MPRIFTVAQLIDRGQKRADKENDDQIDAPEWKENLSAVYGELYEIVAESGLRYYEKEATITADGSASYALPSDHLSTIALDGEASPGGRRYPLRESLMQERNRYTGSLSTGTGREFAIVGTNIEIYPVPASGDYYHTYVEQALDLSSADDGDSVDVVTAAGEAFVTWGLSILAKAKEDSDVRLDRAEKAAAEARLRKWVTKRSFLTPRRIVAGDEDTRHFADPGGWHPY